MSKQGHAHKEEAWRNAKKICRLNVRQVEMARALGMNPKKLPGLRPSPQQRWKLPVGAFIEECYWKRFGGPPSNLTRHVLEPGSRRRSLPRADAHAPERARDAASQFGDLACYLTNLADDLHRSADLGDPVDSGSAPPSAPRLLAARRSETHRRRGNHRRRHPVLIPRGN